MNESEDIENNSSEDNNERTYVPIIKGSKVIKLQVNHGVLPLKKNIEINEFTEKLMPLLIEISNYIDISKCLINTKSKTRKTRVFENSWSSDSFISYWSDLNENQKEFVRIIYENEEINREDLIRDLIKKNVLSDDGKLKANFNGLSAGLTRKWNSLELEPLWIIKNGIYKMNQSPLKLLTGIFDKMVK